MSGNLGRITPPGEDADDVHSDPKLWKKEAEQQNIARVSVHKLPPSDLNSGSRIGRRQYLTLRALWKTHPAADFKPEKFGLEIGRARSRLRDSKEWAAYTKAIGNVNDHLTSSDLGAFGSVFRFQQLCLKADPGDWHSKVKIYPTRARTRASELAQAQSDRAPETPSRTSRGNSSLPRSVSNSLATLTYEDDDLGELPSETTTHSWVDTSAETPQLSPYSPAHSQLSKGVFRPVDDENVVNLALVLFLDAVTALGKVRASWSPRRVRFQVVSPSADKIFEARTDGLLASATCASKSSEATTRSKARSNALSILEVKPCLRESNRKVRMQESAQMAAWIAEEPNGFPRTQGKKESDKTYWRVMISQDRHEVYLLFGRYDEKYISYIRDEPRGVKMTCLVMKGKGRKRGRRKKSSKSKDNKPPPSSKLVQDNSPSNRGPKTEDVKGE